MSILKLKMDKNHISLVKNLKVLTEPEDIKVIPKFDNPSPWGGDNALEDVYNIIYGRPDEFDPMNEDEMTFTDEELEVIKKYISEMPLALDITLFFIGEEITPGTYKTKYHLRDWRKDA